MPVPKSIHLCKLDNYRYVGVSDDDENCDDCFAYEKGTGELYIPAAFPNAQTDVITTPLREDVA